MDPTEFKQLFGRLEAEIQEVIVGHADIIRNVLIAFFAGGHVLLEGAPGLGKTLLVKSLSRALGLTFKRVQFTPDLMPADIIGTQLLMEVEGRRDFHFKQGPLFAHVVLADEINRATPKTQSAVLEAMEEHQVTAFGVTYRMEAPFMVLATQNPIELEGTYPLPEAQLDRFFFKLLVAHPTPEELTEILHRTTRAVERDAAEVLAEGAAAVIARMQQLLRQVLIAPPLEDYVVHLITATQPDGHGKNGAFAEVKDYIRYGSSPRGAQSIILGAKGHALAEGRVHVSYDDIAAMVYPALRHRLILNFQADAETVTSDQILKSIVEKVPRN
ncbi:MAG TPA: MoxR family ATPase [Candidatus Binatia bacterium]|nr:MoxR family ATPase [Candidatus Binatia bacterium]